MAIFSNITISAPLGTSQHGRQDFICFPAKWYTVLTFFIANYLTHAFTLWRKPGEKTVEYAFAVALSLFFPIAGTGRGLDAIYRHASWQATRSLLSGLLGFGDSEYEKRTAAKAGALAVFVREHVDRFTLSNSSSLSHFEHNGKNWNGATLRGRLPIRARGRSDRVSARTYNIVMDAGEGDTNPDCMRTLCDISGLVWLHEPSSYIVMELQGSHAEYIKLIGPSVNAPETEAKLKIAQSSSLLRVLLAILQIAYASYTLARNTGDEIERNGYASFNLTVIPYIIMSFVNLVGNLATPSYPCVYIIATSTMYEAQQRGNIISGHIGFIPDEHLKTVEESEVLRVMPVNCHNADDRNLRGPAASWEAMSSNPKSIDVCFEKGCQYRDLHQSITVASGKPRGTTRSQVAEFFFKCLLGLPIIVAIPIISLVLVQKRYPVKLPLLVTLPVVLWYAVGNLLGMLLLYYRDKVNISFIYKDLKITSWVLWSMVCGIPSSHERMYEKRREYMQGRWVKLVLLACSLVVGLGVAGWNFWHVANELLRFGDCRTMSPT